MGSTTGRSENLPAEEMHPHKRHQGIDISGNLVDSPVYAAIIRKIEHQWGKVERLILLHVNPGSGGMYEHVHPWDSVIYYPEDTYDSQKGYVFVPAKRPHGVPPNTTDEVRVSVVIQLEG